MEPPQLPSTTLTADTIMPPRCTLLAAVALLVQPRLGHLSNAPAYKRATEMPRRPLIVWAFDASKQAFAGSLQHFVTLASACSLPPPAPHQSAWYPTNFAISVVCGVFLLWAFMIGYKWAVEKYSLTLLVAAITAVLPTGSPGLLNFSLGLCRVVRKGPYGDLRHPAAAHTTRRHGCMAGDASRRVSSPRAHPRNGAGPSPTQHGLLLGH